LLFPSGGNRRCRLLYLRNGPVLSVLPIIGRARLGRILSGLRECYLIGISGESEVQSIDGCTLLPSQNLVLVYKIAILVLAAEDEGDEGCGGIFSLFF
jgi:hypothetical protein